MTINGERIRTAARPTGVAALALGLAVALSLGPVPSPATAADSPCPTYKYPTWGIVDFDGDNYSDVAVPEPSRAGNDGAVVVLQSCARDDVIDLNALRYGHSGVRLGTAAAAADLDGDPYTDLVVSVPGENQINLLFGSADGLNQGAPSIRWPSAGTFEHDARFGASVHVVGKSPTDTSTVTRILVGAPGTDVGKAKDAGALYDLAFNGSPTLTMKRVVQGSGGIPGKAEKGDRFGEVLTGGSLGKDSPTVAIGVPREDVGKAADAGAVYVMSGPGLSRVKAVSRASVGAPGTARKGDVFGHAVSSQGNTVHVGVPGHDVGKASGAGAVQQIKVAANGTLAVSGVRTQNSPGVEGTAETGDHLGESLTWSRLNQNMVVAGVPDEDVSGAQDAGAITYLSFDQPCRAECYTQTQNRFGNGAKSEKGDHMGSSLTNYFGPGPSYSTFEPIIGVSGEDVGSVRDIGALERFTRWERSALMAAGGGRLGEVAPVVRLQRA